jgi:hypothetical protein
MQIAHLKLESYIFAYFYTYIFFSCKSSWDLIFKPSDIQGAFSHYLLSISRYYWVMPFRLLVDLRFNWLSLLSIIFNTHATREKKII